MSKQLDAIQVTTLPSGLIVVTETMDRVETVSFGAYVASGTRHEAAEENGVSHFLEHMAFKGTENRSASRRKSRRSAAISTPIPRVSKLLFMSRC